MKEKVQNLNKNGIKQFVNLFNETEIKFPHELINHLHLKYNFSDSDNNDSVKTEL